MTLTEGFMATEETVSLVIEVDGSEMNRRLEGLQNDAKWLATLIAKTKINTALAEENRLLKEHVAERNAIIETQRVEIETLKRRIAEHDTCFYSVSLDRDDWRRGHERVSQERDKLKEENRLVKEGMADRNRLFEDCCRIKAENERLKADASWLQGHIETLSKECGCLKTENEQLKANRFSGYVCTPSADFDTGPGVSMAPLTVLPLTVGNALIQPKSMRIELPGGVVITIPQPKD